MLDNYITIFKTEEMNTEFKWDDKTAEELISFCFASNRPAGEIMEQFKASKQPMKEWEVVAYRHKALSNIGMGNCIIRPGSKHWPDSPNDDYEIFSVRRLSDGELFSVGENVDTPSNRRHNIVGFEIEDKDMLVKMGGGYIGFSAIRKLPSEILTTEDGVKIYKDDEYWAANPDGHPRSYVAGEVGRWPCKNDKFFSTKQAAENWILENRPSLSIKDLKNLIAERGCATSIKLVHCAFELIKSKNNQ